MFRIIQAYGNVLEEVQNQFPALSSVFQPFQFFVTRHKHFVTRHTLWRVTEKVWRVTKIETRLTIIFGRGMGGHHRKDYGENYFFVPNATL